MCSRFSSREKSSLISRALSNTVKSRAKENLRSKKLPKPKVKAPKPNFKAPKLQLQRLRNPILQRLRFFESSPQNPIPNAHRGNAARRRRRRPAHPPQHCFLRHPLSQQGRGEEAAAAGGGAHGLGDDSFVVCGMYEHFGLFIQQLSIVNRFARITSTC